MEIVREKTKKQENESIKKIIDLEVHLILQSISNSEDKSILARN